MRGRGAGGSFGNDTASKGERDHPPGGGETAAGEWEILIHKGGRKKKKRQKKQEVIPHQRGEEILRPKKVTKRSAREKRQGA